MDKSGSNIPARAGKGTVSDRAPGHNQSAIGNVPQRTPRRGSSGLDAKQPQGEYGLTGTSDAGPSTSQRYDPRTQGSDPSDFCYPTLRPTMVGRSGGVKPGRD